MKSTYIYIIIAALGLLLIGEFVSYKSLQKQGANESLFIQKKQSDELLVWEGKHLAYNTIDPLLSWAINPAAIEAQGYKTAHSAIVLEHFTNSPDTTIIYISGGSTSDLMFDSDNWPIFLFQLLKENNYSTQIYIAAVGGYHSGQEYLKTIRDIADIKPDIHISYSGANELESKGYYSEYEYGLFKHLVNQRYTGILPNLRKKISAPNSNLDLYQANQVNTFTFWKNNMRYMHALATLDDYQFYGILQPVIYYGSDKENPAFDQTLYAEYRKDYDDFYPLAQQFARSTAYLWDFTNVFQNEDRLIFKDDCHLLDKKDQLYIGRQIFALITDSLNIAEH